MRRSPRRSCSRRILGRTFDTSAKIDAAIAALTLADVNAALRKYVKPDAFAFVYAGTFAK